MSRGLIPAFCVCICSCPGMIFVNTTNSPLNHLSMLIINTIKDFLVLFVSFSKLISDLYWHNSYKILKFHSYRDLSSFSFPCYGCCIYYVYSFCKHNTLLYLCIFREAEHFKDLPCWLCALYLPASSFSLEYFSCYSAAMLLTTSLLLSSSRPCGLCHTTLLLSGLEVTDSLGFPFSSLDVVLFFAPSFSAKSFCWICISWVAIV